MELPDVHPDWMALVKPMIGLKEIALETWG
jgi:hypothetical protein